MIKDEYSKKVLKKLREYIEVPKGETFMQFSKEAEELSDILSKVIFSARMLQDNLDEYAATYEPGVFCGTKVMMENNLELMEALEKFNAIGPSIIDHIISCDDSMSADHEEPEE